MKDYLSACETSILEAVKGRIEIEELHDDLMAVSDAIENARLSNENASDAVERVSSDRVRSAQQSAVIQKRDAYRRTVRKMEVDALVDEAYLARKGKKDALFVGLRSVVSGANTTFKNALNSAHGKSKGIEGDYNGALIKRLEDIGLLSTFQKGMKGDFEVQVATAIMHLNTVGAKGETPRIPSMTNAGYTDAVKIAKVIVDLQESMRLRTNRAGADIRRLTGFIGHQTHDPSALKRAGFDKWKATFLASKPDWERIGVPASRRDEFMESTYAAMRTGVRKEMDVKEPLATGFKGPKNLARSLSHSRMLHFEDAEGWLTYNKEFGGGSLRDSLTKDIVMGSKNIGVLETLTANPEAFIDDIIDAAERKYRDTDTDAVDYLKDKRRVIMRDLDVVTGDINIGAHSTVAKVGEIARAVKTFASLGAAVLAAGADLPIGAVMRMYQGRSVLEGFGDAFTAPLMRMSKPERMGISRQLGVGFEGTIGSMLSRFSVEDMSHGATSALMNKFFKINGLSWWTDATKSGMTMMLANDFATTAAYKFGALDPKHRRLLDLYGIDEKQWDVIRQAAKTAEDGYDYILPGDINDVSGKVFTGMSEFQQKRLKEQARENLFSLYVGEADRSVVTPGAQEQSFLTAGLTPDTGWGQAARMVGQFKAFPISILSKVVGRLVYGGGDLPQAVSLIVGTTMMGMLVVQMKELAKGREPLPWDEALLMRGLLQGGALGIYGDLLLHKHSEYGGDVVTTMMGPVPNDLMQLFEIAQDIALDGDTSSLGRDTAQLIKGNLPLSNLFYTKIAYDHLITYGIMEALNPGYVDRVKRNLKKRTGQEYWTGDLPFFGGGFK